MNLLGLQPFDALLPGWWMAAYLGSIVAAPLLLLAFLAVRRRGKRRVLHVLLPVDPTSVPRDFARFGQPWIGRLAYLGFPVIRIMKSPVDADPETFHWLLTSSKDRATGVLTGTLTSGGSKPVFSLHLMTFLNDGRLIVTADRMIPRRPPAHWSLAQRHFETLESQVQEHRAQVAARSNGALALVPQPMELPVRLATEERAEFEALQASGDYTACGPDALRPAWSRLPRLACRDFAAIFTGSAFPSGRRKDVASAARDTTPGEEDIAPIGTSMTLSADQLVERDLLRYRKHTGQPPGGRHLFFRIFVLVATLVFFTATFGREAPGATAAMLLGLIAVHEFGHWLAMNLSGYRGMGRFFVPFIGPIDRGRKLHATPWQQIFVILAGPVPGLFAGMAILVAGFFLPAMPLWLLDLGGLAVVLNAFHLLPFLPLDGGKIVDLLVFRDLPLLRPVFTALSAIATLLASFLLHSRPLRVIAIGLFAGLIWDIKMIKVVRGGRRLGWAGSIDDEDDALRRIFRGVREEENESFLRGNDWQRQIDVLLAEVLRKRPGFMTRLGGGALYWACCGLPILALIGIFALMMVGGLGSIGRFETDVAEFRASFPRDERPITEARWAELDALIAATREITGADSGPLPSGDERIALAAKAGPALGASLDRLDWIAAGIAHHADRIDPAVLSIWLEILGTRLETATRDGRDLEATRRAELLLHGIGAMEPALTLDHRELLWDAELRGLEAVEKLSASGKLDTTTLKRIESRVNALNKAPLPEVENLLLVGGWGAARMTTMLALTRGQQEGAAALPEARFWRHAYPPVRRLAENGFSLRGGTPATVALARHWTKSRRVGELPAELAERASAAPDEADFIVAFCENHQRIQWRRLTTLSALGLEAYRLKTGKLPALWKHAIPGGASLTLTQSGGPFLELDDHRASLGISPPAWLGGIPRHPATLGHRCPLHPAVPR
jgi:Zn-dependent protease